VPLLGVAADTPVLVAINVVTAAAMLNAEETFFLAILAPRSEM
jgi:fumarate reductase subunit C